MSMSAAGSTFPDIPATKTGLVEAASNTVRSPPPSSLTGGYDRDTRLDPSSTPALLGRRAASASPQASSRAATPPVYVHVPRPPSTSPREHSATRPRRVNHAYALHMTIIALFSRVLQILEYVRLSRTELEHKDQAITSLRYIQRRDFADNFLKSPIFILDQKTLNCRLQFVNFRVCKRVMQWYEIMHTCN